MCGPYIRKVRVNGCGDIKFSKKSTRSNRLLWTLNCTAPKGIQFLLGHVGTFSTRKLLTPFSEGVSGVGPQKIAVSVRALKYSCILEVLLGLRAPNIGGHRNWFCRKAMLPFGSGSQKNGYVRSLKLQSIEKEVGVRILNI